MPWHDLHVRDVYDEIYGDKLPSMITRPDQNRDGTNKTTLVSIYDIARALGRPTSYLMKYFALRIGIVKSQSNEKTGVFVVKEWVETTKLGEILVDFIQKYSECCVCKNLKTEIVVTGTTKKKIKLKCAACFSSSNVDMKDNFTAFILKNVTETQTDTYLEQISASLYPVLDSNKPEVPVTKKDDDHNMLVKQLRDMLDKGYTPSQVESHLRVLGDSYMKVLFDALFLGVGKGFSKEVIKKKDYLTAMKKKGSQILLLEAIEAFCRTSSPDATKEISHVMMALYDADVLEEKYILDWYQKSPDRENQSLLFWKNVKPFVEWLQTAEYEDEDD